MSTEVAILFVCISRMWLVYFMVSSQSLRCGYYSYLYVDHAVTIQGVVTFQGVVLFKEIRSLIMLLQLNILVF